MPRYKPLALAVMLLLTVSPMAAQMQDPCITTENRVNLLETPPPLAGILEGRISYRFYRFENLRPGESIKVDVQIRTNTSAAVSMLMLWEIRPNQFTHIATEQQILTGGPYPFNFSWTHANLGENLPTTICFKVGLFSEARPAKADYTAAVSVDRLQDTGGGDAANTAEKASSLGALSDTPVMVSGHLSSYQQGSDHVDFYVFTAALGRGRTLLVELNTQEGNIYEIALLDSTQFSLRYNQTGGRQKATIQLTNEDPGEKTYFLKVSNNGGVGGGGPYTINLSIRQVVAGTTTNTGQQTITTNTAVQPTIPQETARAIVYGSVVGIAAAAVVATVLMRRRSQAVVAEEEWWSQEA
ncbi:MAG: hypothetical protein QXV86_00225 [Candidatus Caldarchaeum sp.]